jgi:anti-sigma factor RsiW
VSANPTRHPPLDELSAWVDGEIAGEPERRLLAEHVADCPSCASLAEDFRALARAQVQAGIPPVPPHLEQRGDAPVGEARFPQRYVASSCRRAPRHRAGGGGGLCCPAPAAAGAVHGPDR